ncbi:hypothetical protein BH20ACT5_BH20ACT5_18170 [soil metagenome]
MQVDIRPTTRLRGATPVDVPACIGPVLEALCASTVDLSRLRVVCDWIQYKDNFREVIDVRQVLSPSAAPDLPVVRPLHEAAVEVAVDLRRCAEVDITGTVADLLSNRKAARRIYLEECKPGRESCIWGFNSLYWQALSLWEEATGRAYEQALPGGESDARNTGAVRELIGELFTVWDGLSARNSLPDELYVVELGVGNGSQARTFLDEFVALDTAHGSDYYRRLHYLMGDYSPRVLKLAQAAVAAHGSHVSSLVIDATQPATALSFLRYKAFLVYISNVYDNLPTDEIASIGGRIYRVDVRAYLPAAAAGQIAERTGTEPDALPGLVEKLLRLGPELISEAMPANFATVDAAVDFWRDSWAALRLEERYTPLEGLDRYEIAPRVTGEALRPLLEAEGDIRLQVSNGAVASFVGTLPLLHPYGRIQCHDLFVTDLHQYQSGFHGPGKYDGSVVNWVNGPLLELIGTRRGFDVLFAPFAHRTGTSIKTLTAQVRD